MSRPSVDLQSCVCQLKTFVSVRSRVGADTCYPVVKSLATEIRSYEHEVLSPELSRTFSYQRDIDRNMGDQSRSSNV